MYAWINQNFEDIYLKFLYINMTAGQIFLISHATDETNISSVEGLKQNLILKQRKGWGKSRYPCWKITTATQQNTLVLMVNISSDPKQPDLWASRIREPKLMSRCPVWIPRLSPGDKRFDSENLLLFLSFACI